MSKRGDTLKGVCFFYSETGTEGGNWAFQDSRFVTEKVPKSYCGKCGKYLDPQKYENLKVIKTLPATHEVLDEKEPLMCPEGQHEREIGVLWSYEGLHILENGDRLTIFSPDNLIEVVWSGTICLHQHPYFTEDVFGYWIHADQEGIDREVWATYFFKEYPAELILVREP